MLDFQKIKTWSARNRVNLVTIDNLLPLHTDGVVSVADPDFAELAQRIWTANRNGRPVIIFIGAHVIKSGLSLYLIELMKRGIVTHIAGNGAVSIHDFEIGYLGGTSEDVPCAIEDGSFGMWEETGAWMNEALQQVQSRAGAASPLADILMNIRTDSRIRSNAYCIRRGSWAYRPLPYRHRHRHYPSTSRRISQRLVAAREKTSSATNP